MRPEEMTVRRTLKSGKSFLAVMSILLSMFVFAFFGWNLNEVEASGSVQTSNNNVTVSGNVKNSKGQPIGNVLVKIMVQSYVLDKKTNKHVYVWVTAAKALTNSKGQYGAHVQKPTTGKIKVEWVRKGTTNPVLIKTFNIEKNSGQFAFDLKTTNSFNPLATIGFSY
ncbi:hypothetical protein [Paenibacillus albus]|uniref:Uncharacterized protein n=1 Tax=Paenibacillus albus TaxID=2495582 RepID=A0A3S9A9J4_9BACL|nr:hypothetical protein [Paenibacillus albus]AZN42412.1 hypothetical protein EJC50_24055 [Paenibacillus albus]